MRLTSRLLSLCLSLCMSLCLPLCLLPSLAACVRAPSPPLPEVDVPAPVPTRARPLDDYEDRLLSELARVVSTPGLPSTERVVIAASPKVELVFIVSGLASRWFFFRSGSTSAGGARLYLRSRAGGDDLVLREIMVRVQDFAAQAGFAEWWADNAAGYESVERYCRASLAGSDPLGQLEEYLGETISALVIIPSAMIANCGFGGSIEDPLGRWAINCFGAVTAEALPQLSTLEEMVLHEGGHSFVNHHALEHAAAVARYEALYRPIASAMRQQAYGEWMTCLNEHVLRACHARIYLQSKGEASAEDSLARDQSRGFRYVRALYAKLEEYEASRDRYPDFGSFYEELLTALDPYL